MKVGDLTPEQLKVLIQEAVEEKLREMLGDPDEGLELRGEVKRRLLDSLAATGRGEKGLSIAQVAREAGIEWE